ncbi:MAG: 30S ribosomal protein S7 [Candidatus Caldatribacteriota bacterium]|jgi:small subunit ribosomal protein S7|nr:30S ribosomal protein S7 [Atribacterota bacterium]MDD3031001.1 30S ribosomal protein S7 [Atribacterota bacterium]MDD3640946.1 30S ribosomal protein S7 [Atribacterota bacterium]MDD4288961.1 30S ribosomal protein S7 [Atribacterota bacterium]MDD4764675.1 30S ribosomal protein S7 [Atribacterota bacterium]
MSRKRKATKNEIKEDPVFQDKRVSKFINHIMLDGKKSVSQKIFYDAMDIIKEKTKKDSLDVFNQAMENVMPVLEVKSRRVGGASYQVPVEVSPDRRVTLAMRWIISFTRSKTGRPFAERLASELIDASQGTGVSVKKKEDTHRMADANKAFAHYKW